MNERPGNQPPQKGQPPSLGPPQPPPPNGRSRFHQHPLFLGILAFVAAVLALGIAGCASSSTKTSSSPAPPATPVAPAAPTTSAAPPVAQSVTFACTGTAPDGVDITYGPSGSNFSASKLPFSKTTTLDSSAQYYVTTAQLQGSGSVSCATTVVWDDGGSASTVTNTGAADGGYNIASAQLCSSFTGSWDKC
jgi:hypothetical protein